ncbi:hypothetical protein HDU76_003744 [Blyttiomyces sp. JEL0837]|nr:hypothetical protein HDU76_003744 [Blyttiomyces sp. JEL0837]
MATGGKAMAPANRFDLDNPEYINYLRGSYVTTQVIVLSLAYYIRTKIFDRNDKTPLVYTEMKSFLEQEVITVNTTNQGHDLKKSYEQFQQILLQIIVMALLHFRFGYIRPLLIQTVLGLRSISINPLFEVYILGKDDKEGDLKRPWKAPMMQGLETPRVATPKEVKAQEKKAAKKKLNRSD